jgi:hypothetical protein
MRSNGTIDTAALRLLPRRGGFQTQAAHHEQHTGFAVHGPVSEERKDEWGEVSRVE